MSNHLLTREQVAALCVTVAATREEQAEALGVSRPQLQRYLRDGVTNNCSYAVKKHLTQLAKEQGVL